MKDNNSLAHSTWNCKYHLVFAPKYRRMQICGQIRKDIGVILRRLCEQKGVEIIEAELCPDHIHMLVSIPPKYSVASIMGYLKGKSSLMIFDRHANLKYKYGNRHFWCKGYYVDTVGKNKKAIEEYIKKQLQEDIATDQISIKEYVDPFEKEEKEKLQVEFKPLIDKFKEALGSSVQDVRMTLRLTDSPACIVNDENALNPAFVRMMKMAGQEVPESKPIGIESE